MDEKLRIDVLESAEEKPDISHIPNSMFDQNVDSFAEGETMNRDYLHQIYGESMDFLNKDVRLTRTKYYETREKVEQNFEKETNRSKMLLIVSLIILAVCIVSAFSLYTQGIRYYGLFAENMWDVASSTGYSYSELKVMWHIFGLSMMVGTLFLLVGGIQLYMLGVGSIKRVKELKKAREKALQHLEEGKKECMIMGTYDAGR